MELLSQGRVTATLKRLTPGPGKGPGFDSTQAPPPLTGEETDPTLSTPLTGCNLQLSGVQDMKWITKELRAVILPDPQGCD